MKNIHIKTRKTHRNKKQNTNKIHIIPKTKNITFKIKKLANEVLNKNKPKKETKNCVDLIISSFENKFEKEHPELVKLGEDKWEKILINAIKKAVIPVSKNISPQNDFYTYINYRWLKQQEQITKE